MGIREEFMIERQGKQYALFAGLLDAAHQAGLRSIETELIEKPYQMNENLAIVKARVTMEDGKFFDGIGDARPENVGRNIAPHLIRMAETRAKARALRDAINVGVVAFEEIGQEGDAPPGTRGKAGGVAKSPRNGNPRSNPEGNVTDMRKAQQRTSEAAQSQKSEDPGGLPATRKQLGYLETLLEGSDDVRERLEQKHGKSVDKLTRQEASEAINVLSGRKSG